MPEFNYEALDDNGKMANGKAQGEDADEVVAALQQEGLNPIGVYQLDADGNELGGGLLGKFAIIGISFAAGFFFPLVNGAIRSELMKEGMGLMLGVMTGMGCTAALIAALLTLVERIKSPGKRSLAMIGGILLIVVIILTLLMVIADVMNW